MDLLLPSNIERLVPDWFLTRLKDTDPNLIVYFNPMKQRWIIDRCSRDGEFHSVPHQHTPSCPRTNVLVVQDKDNAYMPLCDEVIAKIRAMDTWSKHSTVESFRAANAEKELAYKIKNEADMRELYLNAAKDDKRQLNQALDLIARHDVLRPHK
jgi:hypothetical protein